MISKDTIDRIFEAARIEEVVADFVQLKKAGSSLKGLSPWSDEKTPSFFVSPAKGIFKDFSSGKGGNSVSFLMELELMTYPEALRYLANKYQIEIEEKELDPGQKEEVSLRESLALVNNYAVTYFEDALWNSDEGKQIGLSYFRERGFSDATMKTFALGYSLDKNNAFIEAAKTSGHNLDHLKKLGLSKEGQYGDYDFFRGRVMFPIRNISGRCLGFGGRTLKSESKAKYLNSPESELYDKSKSLYGMYEAKRSIIHEDHCFIVEGYTDVISLYQAGVEYAVSSSGTSLTAGQVKLIKRYTNNVSLLYDGDQAGIKAAVRGIDLLLEEGMNVKVVMFPDGHDPDSFSRSVSGTELKRYLKEDAKDFTDFMLEALLKGSENDPIRKAEATRRIVESLALISDHIGRSIYVERCSKILGVPEQALYNELNKILRKKQHKASGTSDRFVPEAPVLEMPEEAKLPIFDPAIHEKEIARILVSYGNSEMTIDTKNDADEDEKMDVAVAEYILHDLEDDDVSFHSSLYGKIIEAFKTTFKETGSFPETSFFVNNSDPSFSQAIANMISSPYDLSHNWEEQHKIYTHTEDQNLQRTVFDPLMRLKLSRIRVMMDKVELQLKEVKNEEETTLLLKEKLKLNRMKVEVCKFFGSSII